MPNDPNKETNARNITGLEFALGAADGGNFRVTAHKNDAGLMTLSAAYSAPGVTIDLRKALLGEINLEEGVACRETIFEDAEWKEFEELVFDCNILNWNERYIDLDADDDTQWSLRVKMGAEQIAMVGHNAYPDEWEPFIVTIAPFILFN